MGNPIQQFRRKKRRLNLLAVAILCLFYCSFPTTISLFPEQMNHTSPLFNISWSWLYAFVQIIMTWVLGWVYWEKSKQLDKIVEEMKQGVDE